MGTRPGPAPGPGASTGGQGGLVPPPGPGAGPALPDVDLDTTRDPSCPADAAWIAAARGYVVDGDGAPLPEALIQLCIRTPTSDIRFCVRPVPSGADGAFVQVVPEAARCMVDVKLRVLRPLTHYASMRCHLAVSADTESILDLDAPVVLVKASPPVDLPPFGGEDAVARTITFPDGLELDVRPSGIEEEVYQMLASTRFDRTGAGLCRWAWPEGSREGALDGLHALAPESDIFETTFGVRFPNQTGLAPGTEVDLFVLAGAFCSVGGELLDEATFHQFGTGRVDDAGQKIIPDPGSELPCLSWIGYRRR